MLNERGRILRAHHRATSILRPVTSGVRGSNFIIFISNVGAYSSHQSTYGGRDKITHLVAILASAL